ncbi:unnamed protein product [Sphagnum balticum]
MSRVAIADRDDLKRGAWTAEEDEKLRAYVGSHGTGHWRSVGRKAGLQRCGKSCRLRWTNYLRPNIRHGSFTPYEEDLIVKLHSSLGSRWSLIAARMPGRTDNDIKSHWNTRLKKKLCNMGIDPVTHKPISELLRDIAGTMQPDGSSAAGCNNPIRTSCLDHPHPIISLDCAIWKQWQLPGKKLHAGASATTFFARLFATTAGHQQQLRRLQDRRNILITLLYQAKLVPPRDFNLHSCSDVELEQSAGDRQYCGDVSTLAAQSTSSLIQKEAAVVVDEDLHSWEHSISSTTSNCMSGHRNSCSEVDEVNLERSTSRSPSSRSMQSLQVNSTSSRSKNNMEAAASCWGSQLNITTDRRHHHLHHAADYTSPGTTSPAAFLYLPTAPPLAAASSIKENNPTNNLELSFKSSRDQHHGNLIKELHEISRQFFPAASHGSCRSSTPTTTTRSGSRSSTAASQFVQRPPPPPPVHNFLSDHYGDHQLVPCSWRTTSSMNAATAAAAAAGTSTTSSSAVSTLQVDELAAAICSTLFYLPLNILWIFFSYVGL